MKIITLSDIHTQYDDLDVPDGDVLVIAGDFTGTGTVFQVEAFNAWLSQLPHKHKIYVAGNHDIGFEKNRKVMEALVTKATYLEDSSITIEGVKFHGAPWQPEFCNWAFNLPRGEKLKEKWDLIPDDTDVLITHGPCYGILDSNIAPDDPRVNFGCKDLRARVAEVKPTYHIFGHIHGSYGQQVVGDTTYVNTSICTEAYEPTNKPHSLEI